MISHSVLKLLNYTKFILHKISSAYAVRCSYIFGSSEYIPSILSGGMSYPWGKYSLVK